MDMMKKLFEAQADSIQQQKQLLEKEQNKLLIAKEDFEEEQQSSKIDKNDIEILGRKKANEIKQAFAEVDRLTQVNTDFKDQIENEQEILRKKERSMVDEETKMNQERLSLILQW